MRLLLIEDYKPLQTSLVKGLKEAGFAVDYTGDGQEGFWYATSNNYDVIILDIMLPNLDGLTILEKLRKLGNTAQVLILTAKDTLEDKIKGLDTGADDYLIKPFAFAELLARLRALVRRSYHKKTSFIQIKNLKINLTTQQVHIKNKPVPLTPREYALLEYLAVRTGEIVTRSDIWEHIYEFNSVAYSNIVDVYIGYLRKKFEKYGQPKLIHTIRGRGYLLGEKP